MVPEQIKHNGQLRCDAFRAIILTILPAHADPFRAKSMRLEFKTGANLCICRKLPGFKDEPKSFMTVTQNQEFKNMKTYQKPMLTSYILSGKPGSALTGGTQVPRRDK